MAAVVAVGMLALNHLVSCSLKGIGRSQTGDLIVKFSPVKFLPMMAALVAVALPAPAFAQQAQTGKGETMPGMQMPGMQPMNMDNMSAAQKEYHAAMQKMNRDMM